MVHMNGNLTNRYIFKNTGTKRSLHNMTLWTILENSLWILQKGVSKCLNSIFWWLVFESWVSNFKTCALSGFLQMISDDFQKHEAIFSKIFQHSFKKFMDYSHWSLLKLVVFCCDISWFNSLYWIYSVCHSGTFDTNSFHFVVKIPPGSTQLSVCLFVCFKGLIEPLPDKSNLYSTQLSNCWIISQPYL